MNTRLGFALVSSVFFYVLVVNHANALDRPNVILIVCDDLNDYVQGFGGHPQSQTPNLERLSKSGVSFTQAHCNIPICGPSRASLFTGIYPHHSGCYGFERWDRYEVLKNSRTMMDHFRESGYYTLGTGKLLHHDCPNEFNEYGNIADYGPFAFDATERVAHPDVPAPFRDIGPIDGSFGPLVKLADRTFADNKSYSWQTGNWRGHRPFRVESEDDRDMTADELNGKWAVEKLQDFADHPNTKPFFMGVGFLRPHTPLIVPERFFKQFPLASIKLPNIKAGDVNDTHARSVRGDNDKGTEMFRTLVASFDTQDEALKHFIQAYLASVASVDELIGNILETIENSSLRDNTIVVLTSDHGWTMGQKDYLFKNSLWQESTRIPLIIRAPGISKKGGIVDAPVSLIDLYPTLIDLCGISKETQKNEKGHALDGHSMKPLLMNPETEQWDGPDDVLIALFQYAQVYDPAAQSYSLRTKEWRYIRYENGMEELYHNAMDPHEWTNLADDPSQEAMLKVFRKKLAARIPKPETMIPPPAIVPPQPATNAVGDAAAWKDKYFTKHPDADTDKDGTLTWLEYKAHKASIETR